MEVRWVNSHFKAGDNVFRNWKALVHQFTQLINDRSVVQYKKDKGREILAFLLNQDAMATLAFQLDLQSVFKAISLDIQKKVGSFLGEKSKKNQMVTGLDRIERNQAYYGRILLDEMECIGLTNPNFQPCQSLQNLDAATRVRWKGFDMVKDNPMVVETVVKGVTKTTEVSFAKLSSFRDYYIQTLKDKVEFHLPSDSMMTVFGEFDQREWPNPIADCRKVENCRKLKDAFLSWPGLFGKPSTSANNDFESLIQFLENGCFWNLRMNASPTEFWTLLLSEFTTMSPTLKFQIQATLAVPYGSVAAEVL